MEVARVRKKAILSSRYASLGPKAARKGLALAADGRVGDPAFPVGLGRIWGADAGGFKGRGWLLMIGPVCGDEGTAECDAREAVARDLWDVGVGRRIAGSGS